MMDEMICIDLKQCLKYDGSVKTFIAYYAGGEPRKIQISNERFLEIFCAKNSDAVFLFSCEEEGICYAERICFHSDDKAEVIHNFDNFELDRSDISMEEWDKICTEGMCKDKVILREKGFSVIHNDTQSDYGLLA